MGLGDYGVAITQSGVPVEGAPDYRKTIDTRWKFMSILYEGEVTIDIPATTANFYPSMYEPVRVIIRHGLNYYPAFEASWTTPAGTNPGGDPGGIAEVYSDKDHLLLFVARDRTAAQPATTVTIRYRIFNLNIEEEYHAPTEIKLGSGSGASDVGAKFVQRRGARIDDVDPRTFSLDTTKKTISVHMVKPFSEIQGEYAIEHNVGYPPTFLTAGSPVQRFQGTDLFVPEGYRDVKLASMLMNWQTYSDTDNRVLTLKGAQAVALPPCVIILKDPAELAG